MSNGLQNWEFRTLTNHPNSTLEINKWYNTSPVSRSHQVHVDLLYNDLIPDPFINDYETNLKWISELNWQYRCIFDSSSSDINETMVLIFEGIDTFATIQLNNETILTTDNAFHKYNVPVNIQDHNELIITYESSFKKGKILEKKYGKNSVWNGDSSRVYVRKPQYQYGWDWGPILNTFGFESVKLISDVNYIDDFFVGYKLNDELDTVELSLELLFLSTPTCLDVKIEIKDNVGDYVGVVESQKVEKYTQLGYTLSNVKLWYPIHQGNQSLYTFDVIINGVLKQTKRVGFRKVELIQSDDELGRSFYFRINNKPMQILGTNWIPAHSFTSKLTPNDYSQWMELVANGGYNLIRIWGGGQYENSQLYELCDELGIMIWQDFMFACGVYPDIIIDSVKKEVHDQLMRLRQYCSIIIYAGNNEDYQIAEAEKLDTNNVTQFPAKIIYEDVIPSYVTKLCNQTPYHFGSPYSDNTHKSSDPNIGDLHQWNVWHGDHEAYQNWPQLAGRFVSEFGMLSLPSMRTLNTYIDESQLYPNSTVLDFHTRAAGREYLDTYVWDNFPKPQNQTIESWIYLTQLMQSDALSFAYRYWRRNWLDYKTGGIIVWQLNDCWPSISWSTVDFLKIPKLSYYGIKREISEILIGCYRSKVDMKSEHIQNTFSNGYELDIWGFGNDKNLTLEIEFYNELGDIYFTNKIDGLNFTTIQVNTIIENHHHYHQLYDKTIVYIKLFKNNQIIARSSDWPQPLKHLPWKKHSAVISIEHLGNGEFEITTSKPIKGFELYFQECNYLFNDNGKDIFPKDPQIIKVINFNKSDLSKLKYHHLGTIL